MSSRQAKDALATAVEDMQHDWPNHCRLSIEEDAVPEFDREAYHVRERYPVAGRNRPVARYGQRSLDEGLLARIDDVPSGQVPSRDRPGSRAAPDWHRH